MVMIDELGLRRRGRANEAVAVLHQILHARDYVRVPGHEHNHRKTGKSSQGYRQ